MVNTPDNVTFPDKSLFFGTHMMPVLVFLSVAGVGMQQCMIQNHIFNI